MWVTGTAPPPLLPRCVQALSAPLLTGSIPGPIAFGWVIDKACLLWQDQCGQQGSCFVYQNSAMSWYLLIAGLGYKVSRAASPQGHCGGGVGALESIPKSQESSPTSSRVWAAPGFFQQLHPPLEGVPWVSPLLLVPRRGILPCSKWSLLGRDDLMPVEAMMGQQVQGLCPAHPYPPALWSPHHPPPTHHHPHHPCGLPWGSSQLRLWRNKKTLP